MVDDSDTLFLQRIPEDEKGHLRDFFDSLRQQEKTLLLQNDLRLLFETFCRENNFDSMASDSVLADLLREIPELLVGADGFHIVHRYEIARYAFYEASHDGAQVTEISPRAYLRQKDRLSQGSHVSEDTAVPIDFGPFSDYAPSMHDSGRIGDGIRFLNRHLSSSLFQHPDKWKQHLYEFISLHRCNGQQLLINPGVCDSLDALQKALRRARNLLRKQSVETPFEAVQPALGKMGFEPGWGDTAARVRETMGLLEELLDAPAAELLEQFIARIPMIFKIAIVSPHGWFAQENVLGKPDTGGQVIYILDQVHALERCLRQQLETCGLPDIQPRIVVLTRLIPEAGDTTCGERLEKIHRTRGAYILRVPFREKGGEVVPHWLSRFDIWPYLDRFAAEAGRELRSELDGTPDLIIGNYSDGNLVASLLSDAMNVVQCTVAHALEKTKYLFSDLYWEKMEAEYHFSLQFAADLIAMNKSDFIIASTYQEIAGTEDSIGQYESYQFFSLPGLYQVVNGINLFNPRFNIVPPGVDEENYFPYVEAGRRSEAVDRRWRERLFEADTDDIRGHLADPKKPVIFTMARFDRIKNITGLIEAYGQSKRLQEQCNLIFAAGTIHETESNDREEREEIRKAHDLIERFGLDDKVRWLPSIEKRDTGAVYRLIADSRGVFVQPAHFEAFGLTILEAMLSGLPTFGPQFGGPAEIIVHGENGFLMNTSKPELIAASLEGFFEQVQQDSALWERISKQGIERVLTSFTWSLYSEKLIALTKLYGFWRYAVAGKGMEKLDRYCDLLYHFLVKERAQLSENRATGGS